LPCLTTTMSLYGAPCCNWWQAFANRQALKAGTQAETVAVGCD
jgi:hypothetical protein